MSLALRRSGAVLAAGFGLSALLGTGVQAFAVPVTPASVSSTTAGGLVYAGSSAHTRTTFTLSGGTFHIADDGPIKAGVGCAGVPGNPNAATCAAPTNPNGTFKRFKASAGGGNDYLLNSTSVGMIGDGGSGHDSVVGSKTANDNLVGGADGDTVVGRGGSDYVAGGSGEDTVTGGDGDDTLVGGTGDDTVRGGEGDDEFLSGLFNDGADDIRGEGGAHDEVDYSGRTRQIEVYLSNPGMRVNGEPGEQDRIATVEDVVGTLEAPNYLLGDMADNRLTGGDSKDFLVGSGGADRLVGSGGDDALLTGSLFPEPTADQAPDRAIGGGGTDSCHIAVQEGDTANSCES